MATKKTTKRSTSSAKADGEPRWLKVGKIVLTRGTKSGFWYDSPQYVNEDCGIAITKQGEGGGWRGVVRLPYAIVSRLGESPAEVAVYLTESLQELYRATRRLL